MRKRANAFTLIEMLVTISIIAILIALLLPALSKMRQDNEFMICVAQLGKFATATNLYCNENKGMMPYSNWGANSGGWLYAQKNSGGSWTSPGSVGNFEQRRKMRETGHLWEYMSGTGDEYYCPNDEGPFFNGQAGYESFNFDIPVRAMTSYQMNGGVSGYGAINGTGKNDATGYGFDQFKSNAIIMWECNVTTDRVHGGFWNDGGNRPDEGLEIRHVDGAPVARIDGSSERLDFDYFYELVADRNNKEMWITP